MPSLLLLLSLGGCSYVDDAVSSVKELVGIEEPKKAGPAAPVAEAKDTVGAAKKLLTRGKPAEALEVAQKALAAHPDDDVAWDLVEIAALRSGSAAAMVDKLSPDQPIGNRADRHHALRGTLAVAAGRLPDALLAARALATASPGDAAAILAAAVEAGLAPPADLDASTLELIRRVRDPKAEPATGEVGAAVDALAGWRVAALRGRLALARGYTEGALAEAAKAETGGILGAEAAARLKSAAAPDAAGALAAAEAGSKAAWAVGDAAGAAEILEAAAPRVYSGWKASALADLAQGLRKDASSAENTEGAALIAVVEADASLRAGHPARAREAATAAAASTVAKGRGSWQLALASASLGDRDGVLAGGAGAPEPYASAAKDLAAVMGGADPMIPSSGLGGDEAALQALIAAGWLDDPSTALSAARAATAPDLRLWAEAWSSRTTIPAGSDASAALRAEAEVRSHLAARGGLSGALSDTTHPHALGWTAALGGGGDPGTDPLGAWPRARAAIATGDGATAAKELGDLVGAFPGWRSGPWAPLLVLDGPVPGDLGADADAAAHSADPVAPVTLLHGWKHNHDRARLDWNHGVSPVPAAASEAQRAALWDAVAGVRAGELAWLAGAAPWPSEAIAARDAAEKAVGLVPTAPPTLAELRTNIEKAGILSFARFAGTWQMLMITGETAAVVFPAEGAPELVREFAAAIDHGDKAIAAGDRLREMLFDRYSSTLVGVGRFVVVGAPPLGLVPVTALPEQAQGIRFLAEIRNVAYAPDLDVVALREAPEPERPKVVEEKSKKDAPKKEAPKKEGADKDKAGKTEEKAGKPEEKAAKADPGVALGRSDEPTINCLAVVSSPSEAEVLHRVFPSGLVLLQGPTATVKGFREQLPNARYVHVGDLPTAEGGGWTLSDGVLTLGDLLAPGSRYEGIYLGGRPGMEEVAARLSVGRRGESADALATSGWTGEPFHELMVQRWWEGVNRRYASVRALGEARIGALKELGESQRVPTNWGGYHASSRP